MNFESLDRYLRSQTPEEVHQKKTGELWIDPSDELTNTMIRDIHKSSKRINHFLDMHTRPEHFMISRQTRYAAIPEHRHGWFEIQYIYSGYSKEVINNQPVTLTKGQLLCLDTDVLHSGEAAGENDIIINLLIHQDYCKNYLSNPFAQGDAVTRFFSSLLSDRINHNRFLIVQETPELHFFMRYLMSQYFSPSITSEMIYNNIIPLILMEITKISEADSFMGASFHYDDTALILQYISSNFRTCTLDSLADFFNISSSYLSKLVKNQTGMTYKQLIQHLKLTSAETLLRTTRMPIDMICHESGYENQSHFYKLFTQKYGCTPKEYRSSLIKEAGI